MRFGELQGGLSQTFFDRRVRRWRTQRRLTSGCIVRLSDRRTTICGCAEASPIGCRSRINAAPKNFATGPLTADNLAEWLAEAEFSCRLITDIVIGLPYPTDPYPTFRLKITKAE